MKGNNAFLYRGHISQERAKQYIESRYTVNKNCRRWANLDTVLYFILIIMIALSIRACVLEPRDIKGSSMEQTFFEGDYVLMEKLSYIVRPIQRGDIVILHYPKNERNAAVKRVVAFEGEQVNIHLGKVYINGVLLDESYLSIVPNVYHDGSWVVPENSIFVLGDNRPVSKDSTSSSVGCVGMERVLGRVWIRLYPFNKIRIFGRVEYGK